MVPIAAFALLLLGHSASPSLQASELGKKVVEFCRSKIGSQIAAGECSDLATAALDAVGAAGRAAKDDPADGDYVWGDLIYRVDVVSGKVKEAPDWHAR